MAYDTLRKKFKEKRKELGYTQEKLSELSGICENTIGRIENGRAGPTFTVIKKLLDALELELFVEVNNKLRSFKKKGNVTKNR